MSKPKNLYISGMPTEYRELFDNLCDLMELSRSEFLMLLMVGNGVASGGIQSVIPNAEAQAEWRSLIITRVFEFANIKGVD